MDHDLISPTALLVAYMRAETDLPYAREIATLTDALEASRALLGDDLETFLEYRGGYTELRYKALNAALERCEPGSVLELAAGLSPRGLASPLPYLETDLPEMLEAKRRLVESLGPRPQHRLQSLDALDGPALARAAGTLERPALIHEGLLLYFGAEERHRLAQAVARVLQGQPGSVWITTDVYLRERYRSLVYAHPRVTGAVEKLRQQTGRSLVENVFADADEATAFFTGHGLTVERVSQRALVPRLSLEPREAAAIRSLEGEEVWILRSP
jgi:O-methyltransferase involved in polyketide biosynthesis